MSKSIHITLLRDNSGFQETLQALMSIQNHRFRLCCGSFLTAYLNLCAVFLYTGNTLFLKREIFALLNIDENEIV